MDMTETEVIYASKTSTTAIKTSNVAKIISFLESYFFKISFFGIVAKTIFKLDGGRDPTLLS